MKKITKKTYRDKAARKHHEHELDRKTKHYDSSKQLSNIDTNKFQIQKPKPKTKKLTAPKEFSFIYAVDNALSFFKDFQYYSDNVDHIVINMEDVERLTIEVLLYLISLQNINKNKGLKLNVSIKAPTKEELKILMAQSGFSKYFKAKVDIKLNQNEILPIQDGESNRKNNINDEQTCKNTIDFTLKFFKDSKFNDVKFKHMYNALAEMMTNTDNHAYDEDGEFRNWYLFAIRVESGVAFYFFDNGKGVLKTAKKNLLEHALKITPFSYGHESLIKAVLKGDYRSATGDNFRNKGLPEINQFLTGNSVSFPIILTNKIHCSPSLNEFKVTQHDFRGTLFVWLLKTEED